VSKDASLLNEDADSPLLRNTENNTASIKSSVKHAWYFCWWLQFRTESIHHRAFTT